MNDQTRAPELLPCPFCGGTKVYRLRPTCLKTDPYDPSDKLYPVIRCAGCLVDVSGDNEDYSSDCASAVKAWNTRVGASHPAQMMLALAAERDKLAARVKELEAPREVKALEWKYPEHHDTAEIASTAFGQYTVWEIDGDGYLRRPNEECGWPVGGDINAAKAAANADYERRLSSCYEATPEDTGQSAFQLGVNEALQNEIARVADEAGMTPEQILQSATTFLQKLRAQSGISHPAEDDLSILEPGASQICVVNCGKPFPECKCLLYDPMPRRDAEPTPENTSLQSRVQPWMLACFGEEISADTAERNHRFLEEALELVQSLGCTREEAHQLADYVFDREVGEPDQEVGGTMITLAALCLANNLDMDDAGERELARIWTKVDKIREKQASKPKNSPLPQHHPRPQDAITTAVAEERERCAKMVDDICETCALDQDGNPYVSEEVRLFAIGELSTAAAAIRAEKEER